MTEAPATLVIDFSTTGNASRYIRDGFSHAEPPGTWMEGPRSTLGLPAHVGSGRHAIRIALWPVTDPEQKGQRLAIQVGDKTLGSFHFVENREHSIEMEIPEDIAAEEYELTLIHEDCLRPSDIDPRNNDLRYLSLRMMQLEILPLLYREELRPIAPAVDAEPDMRLIVVWGDWQAHEIAKLLNEFDPPGRRWDIKHVLFDTPIEGVLAQAELGGAIDSLWVQIASGVEKPKVDLAEQQTRVRQIIKFPRLEAHALWPLHGTDPRITAEPPYYSQGRYPYSDRILGGLAKEGLDEGVLVPTYVARYRDQVDLMNMWRDQITTWRSLDALCDIPISAFLEENLRSTRLFYAPSGAAGPLIQYLVEALSIASNLHLPTPQADFMASLKYFFHGYLGKFVHQVPVNPVVAQALALEWYNADDLYRDGDTKWSFQDYVTSCVAWAPWCP